MKVRVELGRISEKGAEKCLRGGLAAGMVGCLFDRVRQAVEFRETVNVQDVHDPFSGARKYAKELRKAFPKARAEIVEIERKLKEWDALLGHKGGFMFGPMSATLVEKAKEDLAGMRARLRRAVQAGMRSCGRPLATEGDAAEAVQDYAFFLQKSGDTGIPPSVSGRPRKRR